MTLNYFRNSWWTATIAVQKVMQPQPTFKQNRNWSTKSRKLWRIKKLNLSTKDKIMNELLAMEKEAGRKISKKVQMMQIKERNYWICGCSPESRMESWQMEKLTASLKEETIQGMELPAKIKENAANKNEQQQDLGKAQNWHKEYGVGGNTEAAEDEKYILWSWWWLWKSTELLKLQLQLQQISKNIQELSRNITI